MEVELTYGSFGPEPTGYNSKRSWSFRESYLVTLREAAHTGHGEITPLPGFSSEALLEVPAAFDRARPRLAEVQLNTLLGGNLATALSRLGEVLSSVQLPPSARFGLESALAEAFCRYHQIDLGQALGSQLAAAPCDLNSAVLLGIHSPSWKQAAKQQLKLGTQCFKVKVGLDVELELQRLSDFKKQLPPRVRLRFDANQSLELEQFEAFAELQPEFIEEPVPTAALFEALEHGARLGCALALDESLLALSTAEAEAALGSSALVALTLKPMLLGGISPALHWGERARAHRVEPVYSHLFDGSLARAVYLELARTAGSVRFAPGLGKHPALALWREQARLTPLASPAGSQ